MDGSGHFSELRVEVVKAVTAPFKPADLRTVLRGALGVPEIAARLAGDGSLVVRVTGDRELRRLNLAFLGDDQTTDVLAFPSGDARGHLGDLAVSWPAVRRQASEHGHPDFAELALLAVHGFLHVLGWDHADEPERAEMTRLTRAALERSGVELASGRI